MTPTYTDILISGAPILISLAVVLGQWLIGQLPPAQKAMAQKDLAALQELIPKIVAGTEQMFPGLAGPDKLAWAFQWADTIAKAYHLTATDEAIRAMIEAHVSTLPKTGAGVAPVAVSPTYGASRASPARPGGGGGASPPLFSGTAPAGNVPTSNT